MSIINVGNGLNQLGNGVSNGVSQIGNLPSTFTNSLPRADIPNGLRPAYTSQLSSYQNVPGPTLVQLGEPIRLSMTPDSTLDRRTPQPVAPVVTPVLVPSPISTLEKKAVKFRSSRRRSGGQNPPPQPVVRSDTTDESESEEEEPEPEPPKPVQKKRVPKPAAPLVVPVVVVPDPEPKSIMKRTEVRQTRPKAPAIVKQEARVEEQAVEDADDCCGCPKRTCAILWFVLFLLALAGLITMLVLYFLNVCSVGGSAAGDAAYSLQCNQANIRNVLTTQARGTDGNFPNAFPGPTNGNKYAPVSRFYLLEGDRDQLLPNSAPSMESLLVWHCGCEVEVLERTIPALGQQPVTTIKLLGDRLKNSQSEILLTVDPRKRYTLRHSNADNCKLKATLISVSPTQLNVNTGWNANSVSSRTG